MERARQDIVRLCHAGLDATSLRVELRRKLGKVIPNNSFWCATVDPATLLFTGAVVDGTPEDALPAFLANEFLEDDVNKFAQLARRRAAVSTLYEATRGRPAESRRYREILVPLGFGNELRAVLRAGSSIWGVLCLHRDGVGFSTAEEDFLRRLAPHLAEGLRTALLLDTRDNPELTQGGDSPGLLVLAEDFSIVAATPTAERWLAELSDWPRGGGLSQAVRAVALRLRALERTGGTQAGLLPQARARTLAGQWLVLHASRLSGPGTSTQTAVIIQPASSVEVAPLILQAYGLTAREAEVARLVLQGLSTDEIAAELVVSPLTVQQHLKAVFDKTGVSSRRELVAQIFAREYWPRMSAGVGLAADGWFATGSMRRG